MQSHTTDNLDVVQPRAEYPRPQFYRWSWMCLNGVWEFDYDDGDVGLDEKWYEGYSFTREISVPFPYESRLSGIGETKSHDVVWYRRSFVIPDAFHGKRILLRFGAVDYCAQVWVNGHLCAVHEGGQTAFSADITPFLKGNNILVVRAEDRCKALDQPRGKQYWEEHSAGIFYTRTTGIWQTVWVEAVSSTHLADVKFTPDIDSGEIGIAAQFEIPVDMLQSAKLQFDIDIRFKGQPVARDTLSIHGSSLCRRIHLSDFNVHSQGRLWGPNNPNLYDVVFTLHNGNEVVDVVECYFGMRKISVEGGRVFLNNYPYKMKLVLDQGYFPDGILTPPSDEAIRRDVELTKQLGFNGARKHQKVEDPRYLYWCDRLGLLVWGEMANSYEYSEAAVRRITQEWQEVIHRDYNHPCIVAWVPINESWGVPRLLSDSRQRAHLLSLYSLTKSLDTTRLVISNDGWEHAVSDLCTIHDYAADEKLLAQRYATKETILNSMPAGRLIYAPGYAHGGEPILVTECGGISYRKDEIEGWGYSTASSDDDFLRRYAAVVQTLLASPVVQGFCYTQLTDVEQEINGLFTYERVPKVDIDKIRAVNEGKKVFD